MSEPFLEGANLSGAVLSMTDLRGAKLNRADLGGADLGGANLYGANYFRGPTLADYERAIELFPDGPDKAQAYSNRGITRRAPGDLAGALADHDRAIELNPDYADAYDNKACVYALMGRAEEACGWLERAIGLDETLRGKAVEDRDFDGIREAGYFRALVDGG